MTITEHVNLVEENARLKIRCGRLVRALEEAATALKVMITPVQHLYGCLWKADPRMPCQCGWHDRLHAGMNQARKAEATARTALAAYEASKATMGAGTVCAPSTEDDAGLRAACEPAPATTNRDRTKMAAAMVRHVCQGFDSGGESMRSIRAQMAEAAFQLLVKDHLDEFAEAFRECEASPYDYLFKARQMLYPYTMEDADASCELCDGCGELLAYTSRAGNAQTEHVPCPLCLQNDLRARCEPAALRRARLALHEVVTNGEWIGAEWCLSKVVYDIAYEADLRALAAAQEERG